MIIFFEGLPGSRQDEIAEALANKMTNWHAKVIPSPQPDLKSILPFLSGITDAALTAILMSDSKCIMQKELPRVLATSGAVIIPQWVISNTVLYLPKHYTKDISSALRSLLRSLTEDMLHYTNKVIQHERTLIVYLKDSPSQAAKRIPECTPFARWGRSKRARRAKDLDDALMKMVNDAGNSNPPVVGETYCMVSVVNNRPVDEIADEVFNIAVKVEAA